MLEFLTRWTPLAQFLGPLIAGVAAVFAARSAGASREAARTSRDAHERASATTAREGRPELKIQIGSQVVDGDTRCHVTVNNFHGPHEARKVRVLVAEKHAGPWHEVLSREYISPRSSSSGTGFPVPPLREKNVGGGPYWQSALLGRLEFEDELELDRWKQTFMIKVRAKQPDEDPSCSIGALRYPQRITTEERETPVARSRAVLAWQVLRGRRTVADE